jgi:uncharacterized membrane protein
MANEKHVRVDNPSMDVDDDINSSDAEAVIGRGPVEAAPTRLSPVSGSKEIGALAHIYRAEVYRSTIWRQRLDMTTNWAVVSTGIGLSISFANANANSLPIVLVTLLSVMFLMLEARRYRYFHVWKFRARILELAVWVPMLRGEGAKIPLDRGDALSEDYIHPKFRVSMMQALGRRIRRNYGYLFTIQGLAYFSHLFIYPLENPTLAEFIYRAHIGPVPGWATILFGAVFHASWIAIAIYTSRRAEREIPETHDALEEEAP